MSADEVTLTMAAQARGLSRRTLAYAVRHGLRARRIGSIWVTTLADVDEWFRDALHRPGPNPGSGRARLGKTETPAPPPK